MTGGRSSRSYLQANIQPARVEIADGAEMAERKKKLKDEISQCMRLLDKDDITNRKNLGSSSSRNVMVGNIRSSYEHYKNISGITAATGTYDLNEKKISILEPQMMMSGSGFSVGSSVPALPVAELKIAELE